MATITHRVRMFGLAIALAGTVIAVPGAGVAHPTPTLDTAAEPARAAVADPDATLGAGWRTSSDVLVTGAGDTDGFHVYAARERDAFAWSTVATLTGGLTEAGAWTGNVCVTGSGRYAVAVYAPAMAVNKPALASAGAFAAIVDLRTGAARRLADRVQLSYSNPGCGPGDRVLLTRGIGSDEQQTDLIGVDAAAGRVTGTTRIQAQLTTPAPGPDGDYGVVRGALVRVGAAGRLTRIGTPGGQPYAVRATAGGAIDLLTVQQPVPGPAPAQAVAYRYTGGRQLRLGAAPRTELALFGLTGGRDVLVGDVSRIRSGGFADLSAVTTAAGEAVTAVSRQAHLLALQAPGARPGPSPLRVRVRATATGRVSTGTVATGHRAPADRAVDTPAVRRSAVAAGVSVATVWPSTLGLAPCAVPRNDIHRQALQPSANQIEWAVDLAVQGRLTVQRPANYLKTGMPAYTPQGMFPLPAGPRVPAQVLLAVLAQETNMAQATWHAVPGDPGNSLISDYYGLRADPQGRIEQVDFSHADCGYGIAQVTDGMRRDSTRYTAAQRVAIATDYAANIAAGLQILVQKWNEVKATDSWVNNDDPRYIENWFLPVWGYNSGVHAKTGSGPYGLGWFNNPANPRYPANRHPFLRGSLDDSRTPSNWSYPERIMGWAEIPQWQWIDPIVKYTAPNFGSDANGQLALPGRYQFCGPVNNCSSSQPANPCPAANETCWWHGVTSWLQANSDKEFATENLSYAAGAPEPPLIRRYPAACTPFPARAGLLVVDDLTDSSNNLLCAGQPWGGKFTLRLGNPTGTTFSDYTQVDVHQMPGYLGHAWFTHAYDPNTVVNTVTRQTADNYHRVIGTWTPNLTDTNGGTYEVVAHLPSHGANITYANYVIKTNDSGNRIYECAINQQYVTDWHDKWVYLGTYQLFPGARVQLSNMVTGQDGTVDVGYDAIAFAPISSGGHGCQDLY
jgi:hypothetical protein